MHRSCRSVLSLDSLGGQGATAAGRVAIGARGEAKREQVILDRLACGPYSEYPSVRTPPPATSGARAGVTSAALLFALWAKRAACRIHRRAYQEELGIAPMKGSKGSYKGKGTARGDGFAKGDGPSKGGGGRGGGRGGDAAGSGSTGRGSWNGRADGVVMPTAPVLLPGDRQCCGRTG